MHGRLLFSEAYLDSILLFEDMAAHPRERRLLKFARRYALFLPGHRAAAISARPHHTIDFDLPSVNDITRLFSSAAADRDRRETL